MKRTVLTIILCLSAGIAVAQSANPAAKSSLWQRIELGTSFNYMNSAYFRFGPGLLANHPERAIDATASIHIWNHFEAGAYLSLQGASPFGTSRNEPVASGSDDRLYVIGWDGNGLQFSGGAFFAAHLLGYLDVKGLDVVARVGLGLGGQTDGAWFGVGFEYAVSNQLRLSLMADFGGMPAANLLGTADGTMQGSLCLGLKYRLK